MCSENAHTVTATILNDVVNLADLSEADEMDLLTAGDDTTGTDSTAECTVFYDE